MGLTEEDSGRSRYGKVEPSSARTLFVVPWPHAHSCWVRWECINCHPLATSEHCKHTHAHTHTHTHTHTDKHILLSDCSKVTCCPTPLSFRCLSLSRSRFRPHLLHLSTTTSYQLTHTHTWCAPHTASFSCLGKDTVKLTHPELSCHLCHLGLVCVCVFLCCVCVCLWASPWAGSVLWEVTVNMHKLGCMGRGTGLDLIIISETERTWLIGLYVLLYVRANVLVFRERAYPPPTLSHAHKHTQVLVGYTDRDGAGSQTQLITTKTIKEKRIPTWGN